MSVAVAALLLLVGSGQAQAQSAKLYVANNGVDTADCGPESAMPCRSISRAIAHANPGDQIIVGPGLYGDLNRDGTVDPSGDSGEENTVAVEPVSTLSGTLSLAMIHIDKQLTIVSRDGAGATVIDASGQFVNGGLMAVNVAADGAVFGKRRKGFTIRNAGLGLHVEDVAGVRIAGITAETCYSGFAVGSATSPSAPMPAGTTLKGNVAMNNYGPGFAVVDESAVLQGNLAKGNFMYGFLVLGAPGATVTKNLAVENLGSGFFVAIAEDTGPAFSKNAAIGNTDAGLFLTGPGTVASVAKIAKNSFFGNGVRPQYPPANCGLVIQNGGAEMMTVNADGNYWGAASGPGADPADAAGGGCTAGGPVTLNLAAWSSKEIRVSPPLK